MTGRSSKGPISDAERIVSIDVLRGFALLGILAVNIQSFSMISAAYMNPTAYGDFTGVNYAVWWVTHVAFDQKFMTIFSMLFGAGIVLMSDRMDARGGRTGIIHFRRMAWLTAFGILHAHLFWFGDILFFYGICGMLVYPLRHLSQRALLAAGAGFIAVASMLWVASALSMPQWPDAQAQAFQLEWQPDRAAIESELAAYRGGWATQMTRRVPTAVSFETVVFLTWGVWRAGGLMLIGMALFRHGVFRAERSRRFYLSLMAAAALLGLPLIIAGISSNQRAGWDVAYSFFLGSQFNYWGSLPFSLGLVSAVMLACKSALLPRLKSALAAVGRMALTNYLLQTLLCTTIFYGHGLGLFGHLERSSQALLVVAIWALQLVISPLWLTRYRFGPAEWIWRSLTYLEIPDMSRKSIGSTVAP